MTISTNIILLITEHRAEMRAMDLKMRNAIGDRQARADTALSTLQGTIRMALERNISPNQSLEYPFSAPKLLDRTSARSWTSAIIDILYPPFVESISNWQADFQST